MMPMERKGGLANYPWCGGCVNWYKHVKVRPGFWGCTIPGKLRPLVKGKCPEFTPRLDVTEMA